MFRHLGIGSGLNCSARAITIAQPNSVPNKLEEGGEGESGGAIPELLGSSAILSTLEPIG
jgi:hypothetical protein